MTFDRRAEGQFDLVVVGSGVAGLTAAITAADRGERVLVLTKSSVYQANTRYAQGGIAAALGDGDSAILHAFDTLGCGGELNDSMVVETVTSEATTAVDMLLELGVRFDARDGRLELGREAAHSLPRVVHWGDSTGVSVQRTLVQALRRRSVPLIEQAAVIQLEVSSGYVAGATFIHAGHFNTVFADRVLVASGGAGQLYNRTTNPAVATADGLCLCFQAGAELMDLEFFQFHPTALVVPGAPAFLISEAARGEGAALRNAFGEAFMHRYHSAGDLAPRDVVSRAIWQEMLITESDSVWLDLTPIGGDVATRFPQISRKCERFGLDVSRQAVPVAPAAHYFMGGVRSDADGRTTVPGLFVAGEVACTGLHGANRLASNSVLEGLIVGRRAALASGTCLQATSKLSARDKASLSEPVAPLDRDSLQVANWRNLGIVRSERGLQKTLDSTSVTLASVQSLDLLEDQSIRVTSNLIAQAAIMRTESRGAHFRSDYPRMDADWRKHVVLCRASDGEVLVGASETGSLVAC